MLKSLFAGASLIVVATACTSAPEPAETTTAAVVEEAPSQFDLAMGTVQSLREAGNEQVAIDRLTLLLGDPGMSDAQMAKALLMRAELRHEGNNLEGAIDDLKEIQAKYPGSAQAEDAAALLVEVEAERDALTDMLDAGNVTAMERFEILFRLGRHQEASDIMLAGALEPENAYIVDMYQIGYLCDGDELAGPVFELVEPDGSSRPVQFCDLGK